jgi:hypothetical protein
MENSIEQLIADKICSQVSGWYDEFDVEVESEDMTISVSGIYSIKYRESYDSGWEVEDANCRIRSVRIDDEIIKDGNLIPFSISEVEYLVKEELEYGL